MVNMYESEFSLLQQEILRFLFVMSGSFFNARKLANFLGRTQAGIIKAIPKLEKDGLVSVKKDKYSGRWSIGLNRDSRKVIEMKRVENLKMIYESGLVLFLEENFLGATIILFGSYSRGDDVCIDDDEGHKSDIDIAIIGVGEKDVDIKRFEKRLKRKIIINFYSSFEEIHKFLKDNLMNGIVLSGSIDL